MMAAWRWRLGGRTDHGGARRGAVRERSGVLGDGGLEVRVRAEWSMRDFVWHTCFFCFFLEPRLPCVEIMNSTELMV
jgi:hypothetical protein